MILTDCHVHSCFSSDSKAPVEAMIEQAISHHFPYFYLTDHMDYDFPVHEEGMDFLFDPKAYFLALEKYQSRYGKAIHIRPAVELGLKPSIVSLCRSLLTEYPFDFVIGSTHLVENQDPYSPSFWENRSEKEALTSYFEAVHTNLCAFPEVDSCGHLDYAVRYAPSVRSGKSKKSYFYRDYADLLDTILKLLIQKGIALEVNTAGYVKGLGEPNPQKEVLLRYRELGGVFLTIGSDAHIPSLYACEFARAEALLKNLGFRYYTIYKQRKPEMLPL